MYVEIKMGSTTSQLKFDHLIPFCNMGKGLTEGTGILSPGFITKICSCSIQRFLKL